MIFFFFKKVKTGISDLKCDMGFITESDNDIAYELFILFRSSVFLLKILSVF